MHALDGSGPLPEGRMQKLEVTGQKSATVKTSLLRPSELIR